MPHDTPHTDPAQHALDDQNKEAARADRHDSQWGPKREEQDYRSADGSAPGPEDDDVVMEASVESFPASDPPSWTPERL